MDDSPSQSKGLLGFAERVGTRIRSLSPRIRSLNAVAIVVASILAIVSLATVRLAFQTYSNVKKANAEFLKCSEASTSLQAASDYLTTQARMFVVTGHRESLDGYLAEASIVDRRGKAVLVLENSMEAEEAIKALEDANTYSNDLEQTELYAMRLAADGHGTPNPPLAIVNVKLSEEDEALSNEQKLAKANDLVFNDQYLDLKLSITERIDACATGLMADLRNAEKAGDSQLTDIFNTLYLIILLLLAIVVFVIFENIFLILWPIATQADRVSKGLPLVNHGARELNSVVDSYNTMFEENRRRTELLQQMAETDSLTGLLNRGAYDALLKGSTTEVALMLADVDHFKEFNDLYGHEVGDLVLQKVARTLSGSVRSADYACRIGGDEFALIMTEMKPELRQVIERKIAGIAELLNDTSDGLPPITLSVGVAFSEEAGEADALYRAADKALYVVKRNGRNGCAFFGDE